MYTQKRTTKVFAILLAFMMATGVFVLQSSSQGVDSTYAASGISVSGTTYPTTITVGNPFVLKGTIKSTYKLKSVKVEVGVIKNSKWQSKQSYTAKPNSKTYSIYSASPYILFGKLSAGTYYYRVTATDVKGTSKRVINKKFTVAKKSSISISNYTYPKTTLTVGSHFTLKGTIKSTYKLKSVKAGVVKVSNNEVTWQKNVYATAKPNAKTYSIAGIDSQINFAKLSAGTYYYRVYATDSKGVTKRLVNKKFKVQKKTTTSSTTYSSEEFEEYMNEQGFPASYKPYLRKLKKAHPTWTFVAQKTGLSWNTVISKESTLGTNLVYWSYGSSYKSTASGAYNSKTKKYTYFDGYWNQASTKAIKYYMDPRNFLNESGVYQFMGHYYSTNKATKTNIKSMVTSTSGCFMNTTTYISSIYSAAVSAKINPAVLTAMVIQEQGWKGGNDLISGKYTGCNKKYYGYYNHFNIGAYKTSTMTPTQRGLWYAKGGSNNSTTYSRPWNSITKSLKGGVTFYKDEYISNKQYTYYTKKFNVLNGASNVGKHQYMTNLMGANSEGALLKKAYTTSDKNLTFYIPVYSGMPSSKCAQP